MNGLRFRLFAGFMMLTCVVVASVAAISIDGAYGPEYGYEPPMTTPGLLAGMGTALPVESRVILDPLDIDQVLYEDETGQSGTPHRVGVVRDMPWNLSSVGLWAKLPDGRLVWRGSVVSPMAKHLRLHFDAFNMPGFATVYVYSAENPEFVRGPYQAGDPNSSNAFWSHTIPGEEAIVEVIYPPMAFPEDPASLLPFSCRQVAHIYRTPDPVTPLSLTALNTINDCHTDAMCFPPYDNASRSVGLMYFVDGADVGSCSGTLLNDTRSSGSPWFLSANHCIGTQIVADSLEVFWLWRSDTCRGVPPSFPTASTLGATLLATTDVGTGTDFSFFHLSGNLPGGLFFSGWTDQLQGVTQPCVGIHHPNGDYQRLASFEIVNNNYAFTAEGGIPTTNKYYRVSALSGAVEPGSSGSALFNTSRQVVGQLYGVTTFFCNQDDVAYGRFRDSYPLMAGYLDGTLPLPTATATPDGTVTPGTPSLTGSPTPTRTPYVRDTPTPPNGTPGATNTNTPTRTPYVRETPTPTNNTPGVSPTKTPTRTPYIRPTSTPTATFPPPGDYAGVEIFSRVQDLGNSQELSLDIRWLNKSGVDQTLDLYIVFEMFGTYFFFGSFSEDPVTADANKYLPFPTDSGQFRIWSLPMDYLPEAVTITWYAATLDSASYALVGGIRSTQVQLLAAPQ